MMTSLYPEAQPRIRHVKILMLLWVHQVCASSRLLADLFGRRVLQLSDCLGCETRF